MSVLGQGVAGRNCGKIFADNKMDLSLVRGTRIAIIQAYPTAPQLGVGFPDPGDLPRVLPRSSATHSPGWRNSSRQITRELRVLLSKQIHQNWVWPFRA